MPRRSRKPSRGLFTPDISRFNPDPNQIRSQETEVALAKCGILYLEDRPTDLTGGESFSCVKKELVRVFSPNKDSTDGGVGIPESPIELYINTQGCPVNDGMALYDQILYMRKHYNMHIYTIAQGFALSGGALALQSGTKRIATENSIIMIHGVQTDGVGGTMKEVETEVEALQKMNQAMTRIWAKKMGIKPKNLEDELKLGDLYFTAKEALKAGLVDEVL